MTIADYRAASHIRLGATTPGRTSVIRTDIAEQAGARSYASNRNEWMYRAIKCAVLVGMLAAPSLCGAQSEALSARDRSMILSRALEVRADLIRDSASVDACSLYRIAEGVDSIVRAVTARATTRNRFTGPAGPGCAMFMNLPNRVFFQSLVLSRDFSDSTLRRFPGVEQGSTGIAILTLGAKGTTRGVAGYSEIYRFIGVGRGPRVLWDLLDVRLDRFQVH